MRRLLFLLAAGVSLPLAAQGPVKNLVTPAAAPTPGPTHVPRATLPGAVLAALEIRQGSDVDRMILWDDGTVVLAETRSGEKWERRHSVSRAELDVVRRVLAGASAIPRDGRPFRSPGEGPLLRKGDITISLPGSETRSFSYDDLSSLPVAYGRVRGALEDLLGRLRTAEGTGPLPWDGAMLGEGDVLRRRGDAKRFRVVRDDRMSRYLELVEEDGPRLERMFLTRREVPRLFGPPVDRAR